MQLKIDSVFALSGYQRQVIDIYYSAPRIDHGIIVYNLNQDTVVFELPEDGSRHFSVPINNLEEAEYNYPIYTFDKDGNKSLPTETSGKVYGRFYGDYLVREKRSTKSILWTVSPSIPKEQPKPKASMLLIPT